MSKLRIKLVFSFTFTLAIFQMDAQVKVFVMDENKNPLTEVIALQLPDSVVLSIDEGGSFKGISGTTVLVTKIGFESILLAVSEKDQQVQLKTDPIFLTEVKVNDLSIASRYATFSGSIGIISDQELRRGNQTIISSHLNNIPGVFMQSGVLNTNRITIRGIGARSPFSTNKIRAYFGEIPLTNGSGETTIEDIDLSNLGSVEVLKGPNSSIYGSGLGGTMLIKKRNAAFLSTEVFSSISLGAFGLRQKRLGLSHHDEDKSLMVNYGNLHSDGYRENNELDRHSLLSSFDKKISNGRVSFLGYLVDQKAFIPSSLDQTNFDQNPKSAAFTWGQSQGHEDYTSYLVGLSIDKSLGDFWTLKSSVNHSFKDNYEPRPFNILDDKVVSLGSRNRLIYENSVGFSAAIGVELFGDTYSFKTFDNLYEDNNGLGSLAGSQLSDFEEKRFFANTFGQIEYQVRSFSFSGGLNINSTSYDLTDRVLDDNSNYNYGIQVSPRLGINYMLNPRTNLFAVASNGFSTPSLEETLNPDGEINSEIEPETGWNFEVGGRRQSERLFLELSIYSMQIDNLLVGRRTAADQYVGINAGSTSHDGFEMLLKSQIVDFEMGGISIDFNYAYMDYTFNEFLDDNDDFSGNSVTGVPGQTLNLSTVFSYRNAYLRPRWQFVDEMPLNDANDEFNSAYSLLNLEVGYSYELKKMRLDFSYRGENLLNAKYASMVQVNASGFGGRDPRYFYPGLPINHNVTLKINYQIKKQ